MLAVVLALDGGAVESTKLGEERVAITLALRHVDCIERLVGLERRWHLELLACLVLRSVLGSPVVPEHPEILGRLAYPVRQSIPERQLRR